MSVFNVLSPPIIKNLKIGSENFPTFFDFTCADRQNFQKNRFFQILIFALMIFLAERLKVSTKLDFQWNPSNKSRETDNFQLFV